MISEDRFQGFRRLTLTGDGCVASFLPELGGKLVELRRTRGSRNALLTPPEFPYRRAVRGAAFEDFDTSGFDECFPTVSACPSPDSSAPLPDHGDLWSIPWDCQAAGDALAFECRSAAVPAVFRRRATLGARGLRLDYEVESLSTSPFRYLWSAHPLLAVSEGSRILLPASVDSLLVNWSRDARLGRFGDRCGWPRHRGMTLDVLEPARAGTADKLFTPALSEGFCAYHDRASGESVTLRFDPGLTPYVGLWICQGGWPTSRAAKHYTVALEPCSGQPDALSEAAQRNACRVLAPKAVDRWWLEVELRAGPPAR
jgi:hypothetical protein